MSQDLVDLISDCSLQVGVLKARSFAYEHSLPIIPVHHMEAHALLPRMDHLEVTRFPYLCILISGGHNLILIVHSVGVYTQMATTIDDSLGKFSYKPPVTCNSVASAGT